MGGLRFGSLEVFGALLLSVLAGCGGRSTFDSDELSIDANQPAGGSSMKPAPKPGVGGSGNASSAGGMSTAGKASAPAGGSPAGGTAGSGVAGNTPTPGSGGVSGSPMGGSGGAAGAAGAAGAISGGASGLDPLVAISCADYCDTSEYGPCPNGFPISECVRSCVSELSTQSLLCQKAGATLLSCLTTVYKNSSSCSEINQLTRANCSALFEAYHACTAPTPDPVPAPKPPPPISCSSSGSSSNGKCSLDVKCNSGAVYSVSCYQTSPEQSNCTCNASFPNGSGTGSSFGLNESASYACYDSLATCGFPQFGAP